jgi:hypothetical protein
LYFILFIVLSSNTLAQREIELDVGLYSPSETTLKRNPAISVSYAAIILEPVMMKSLIGVDRVSRIDEQIGDEENSRTRFYMAILVHAISPIGDRESLYFDLGTVGMSNDFAAGLFIGLGIQAWITRSFALRVGGEYKHIAIGSNEGGITAGLGIVYNFD